VFLAVWCAFCSAAFADRVRGLQEIYETPIPTEIRRNFDRILQIHTASPEATLTVLDGEKFIDIYAKKFLVVGMEPNGFGGIWAVVAIEGNPKDAFLLWLYDVDRDEYDLRSVEKLPDSLDEELMSRLRSPAYRRYWM
jgi:hypothetical protein